MWQKKPILQSYVVQQGLKHVLHCNLQFFLLGDYLINFTCCYYLDEIIWEDGEFLDMSTTELSELTPVWRLHLHIYSDFNTIWHQLHWVLKHLAFVWCMSCWEDLDSKMWSCFCYVLMSFLDRTFWSNINASM